MTLWDDAFLENPLIAILRGVAPAQAIEVADVLVDAGFRIIEVPLNSPDPLNSIRQISDKHGDRVIVGAGTVLTADDVSAAVGAGGKIIVSPNMKRSVGLRAIELGARWCPGVLTPSEAFEALELGASVLKFFPAEMVPPRAVAAMRAVLPGHATLAVVGGISPDKMAAYIDAGANSFGLGSALFKPSYDLSELRVRATAFMTALGELKIS